MGFYPVEAGAQPYDAGYFDRYAAQANTEIGRKLMSARVEFVNRHHSETLVDIGIGSGAFINERNSRLHPSDLEMSARFPRECLTYGYDVNPVANEYLKRERLYWDVYNTLPLRAVSMWDVLEHIPEFDTLLDKVQEWVFVSIPIFTGPEHVLRSKHYRKDEHVWYFTTAGLRWMFSQFGFDCVEIDDVEGRIGREDIGSFAFKRRIG